MNKAFLSYSRKDKDIAIRLKDELQSLGLTVWMDQGEITAGDVWRKNITAGLAGSQFMLLLVTEASMNSSYVREEWENHYAAGKMIVPLILEKTPLPAELSAIHYLSFSSERFEASLAQLCLQLTKQGVEFYRVAAGVELDYDPPIIKDASLPQLDEKRLRVKIQLNRPHTMPELRALVLQIIQLTRYEGYPKPTATTEAPSEREADRLFIFIYPTGFDQLAHRENHACKASWANPKLGKPAQKSQKEHFEWLDKHTVIEWNPLYESRRKLLKQLPSGKGLWVFKIEKALPIINNAELIVLKSLDEIEKSETSDEETIQAIWKLAQVQNE